jgi:hypothetical protein
LGQKREKLVSSETARSLGSLDFPYGHGLPGQRRDISFCPWAIFPKGNLRLRPGGAIAPGWFFIANFFGNEKIY